MATHQETRDYVRFCPGEEHIKISNAICRGRRNSHFPKCRGCKFNDDERGTTTGAEDRAQSAALVESVFKKDGVCAPAPIALTEDVAWRIGHATAQFLRGKLRGYDRANADTRAIIVGRDARTHGAALQKSLMEGMIAAGMDVANIGMVDTPQLYFAVQRSGACGGVQTTAGRMPAEYDGFLFCAAKATPIAIDTGLASIRDIAARVPKHETATAGRLLSRSFARPYVEFVQGFLSGRNKLPRPCKVVVDASNGMAGKWLPAVFGKIKNLEIVPLNFQHDGRFVHDPDPLPSKNGRALRKLVKQEKADFGVCFDGDASGCAFVDEKGLTVPPDIVAAVLARLFIEREPGAAVAFDLRSSDALPEEIDRAGGAAVRCRIDSVSIKKAMAEQDAVFGSDLTGRYYFRNMGYCESGLLAFVHVLNVLVGAGRKLSELTRPLQRYRSSGELRLPVPDPAKAVRTIAAAFPDAHVDDLDGTTLRCPDWWANLRRHADDATLALTLHARTKALLDERLSQIKSLLA